MPIQEIKVNSTIYRFEGVTEQEARKLKDEVLTDPVTQQSQLNYARESSEVEIGYKPGVTDPIELSLFRAANLLDIHPLAVSSSRVYKNNAPKPSQIEMVINKKPQTLVYESTPNPAETIPLEDLGENELIELSKTRSLFLNLEEMRVIQNYYQRISREPTDLELEMLAQTWSEHCGHKTFKAILVDEEGREKEPLFTRIKEASLRQPIYQKGEIVTPFIDNAGGMRFYEGKVIIGKGETHNSPVAIEPYAGALTKNGGVYRDIAGCGLGGKNLVGLMINNFSSPFTKDEDINSGSIHPKVLLLENSRGEREYGNPMGIPTHAIDLHFHKDFGTKPTSLGVAVGILPESRVAKGKPQVGDMIVAVGGKTGRDGIHGATFSSGEMTHNTHSVHSTAVQLGDPIVEKTMFDALVECRDRDLVRAITDCGAGGFSSSVGEMANGVGAEVWLEKILTKYPGLSSWEKWLSESQERMVVAVAEENWEEFKQICTRYDTNADEIGIFTGDNTLRIYEGNLVGKVDLEFLHNGLPQRRMQMKYKAYPEDQSIPELPQNWKETFKCVLSHLNVCSKEEMHRQYDMSVQGMSVMAPFVGVNQDVPSEASILAPIRDKRYGLVTTHAINPVLNRIDPYWGSVWAFTHAATRYTAAGGNIHESCGIDNYISPSPDPKALADLDKMTDGLCDMIDVLGVPMVSGKDSLSSTYRGPNGEVVNAPPSLNITIFGRIPDYGKTITPDFKKTGSVICLVGRQDVNAMGGSVYLDTQGLVNSNIPKVDVEGLADTLEAIRLGIEDEKILSAKAIGEGGLAVALAQMCFGGECGADVEIAHLYAKRPDFAVFNETAGCMLVELENGHSAHDIFGINHFEVIGVTTKERTIKINNNHHAFINADIDELKEAWKKPMKEILNG